MQVITICCIDMFIKYYKVKYHSDSPYSQELHKARKYMEKLSTSVFGTEIYTNRSI